MLFSKPPVRLFVRGDVTYGSRRLAIGERV